MREGHHHLTVEGWWTVGLESIGRDAYPQPVNDDATWEDQGVTDEGGWSRVGWYSWADIADVRARLAAGADPNAEILESGIDAYQG